MAGALEGAHLIHMATHGFFRSQSDCLRYLAGGDQWAAYERLLDEGGSYTDLTRLAGLALSGASSAEDEAPAHDDGVLDGAELRALDLSQAALVTLSACETGLGITFASDGLHALARAVLEAGAQRALTSLWQVPSAPTSALFIDMYDAMLHPRDPLPPRRALRKAKLEAIERARAGGLTHSSFLWASFVLTEAAP